MPSFHQNTFGRKIAYEYISGEGPTVVFLGGFMSDMSGSKAVHLERWAKECGQAYLRFDYAGHGQSSGVFIDHAIGDWVQDAGDIIQAKTSGPLILIGSSMGGWISLILAQLPHVDIAGLVTINAAPDFTEASMWANFTQAQKDEVLNEGVTMLPSDYGEDYPITKRLIEDGRTHLVMDTPLNFDFPVLLLQGAADTVVTRETALNLFDHIGAKDSRLILVKDGDHSLSTPHDLNILTSELNRMLELT